jgi:lipopolysaccharide heptosyltransferase I
MSIVSRVPLAEYEPRRIALLKPSALGDIVNSLPVLTALRQRYPDAHITWVVNRGYEPLLRGHPDLNDVLAFDRSVSRSGFLKAVQNFRGFFRELRRWEFDLVVDLQGLLRTGLMALATAAPRRVGLSSAREGATWFYTDLVPVANYGELHAVDRYWLVAEALGAGHAPKEFRLPIDEVAQGWATSTFKDYPRPCLALVVGSRWVTKRWPPEHFAQLARWAQAHAGGTVVFVGGGDETSLAQATGALLDGPWHDLTGQTSLPQLTAVLAQADVVVSNDSGPLHLATALGRPVVAPYTCTKVRLNGPYGAASNAVEAQVWCQGSYRKRCSRLECMTELTPARLWPVLRRELEPWRRHSLPA